MAGQLDTALKNIAKQVIADLGDSLDTSITLQEKHLLSTTPQLVQYLQLMSVIA